MPTHDALADAFLNIAAAEWTRFSAGRSRLSVEHPALLNKTPRRDIRNDSIIMWWWQCDTTHYWVREWCCGKHLLTTIGANAHVHPITETRWEDSLCSIHHVKDECACTAKGFDFHALQIKPLKIAHTRLCTYPSSHTTCLDHGLSYLVHASEQFRPPIFDQIEVHQTTTRTREDATLRAERIKIRRTWSYCFARSRISRFDV